MELITKAVKGTQDILPKDSYKYNFIENILKDESETAGFKEIRTPVFEHTELFKRSVGATTDVVQKEMYTFDDKADRSLTLRPEGTASTVRAMLEHGLFNEGLPLKLSYIDSCYRYEKPQSGRLREFHQFGLEIFGTDSPIADAELIRTANNIFTRIGIKNLLLQINSIGCSECRKDYQEALRKYFVNNKSKLCKTCLERLERNPMRILDCKNPECKEVAKDAPIILDYICDDCKEHFESVKSFLDKNEIKYSVNPGIVRGLDYYTRTVFEFVSNNIGAQSTVCGGGRYDSLVKEIGGKDMPSLGCGFGIERLMLLIESLEIEIPKSKEVEIYIAAIGKPAMFETFDLAGKLRECGIPCEYDITGRSLKSQMKYANKIGAKYSIVLGDEEIEKGRAILKNMQTKETRDIIRCGSFFNSVSEAYLEVKKDEFEKNFDISNLI